MLFEHVVTKSSPDFVLSRLKSESRSQVVDALSEVLVSNQAQALAKQCQAELPGAERAVKQFEKDLAQAEKVAAAARKEFEKAQAEEKALRRQKGLGEKQLLAVGQVTKDAARVLDNSESAVRFSQHDLRHARQRVRNLARLVDGLSAYELPEGDVLPLLARALVNGNG